MSDIDKRVSVLETIVNNQERRVELLEEKNEQLNEIATYLKLQYKHNKSQDEKIEKMSEQFEQNIVVLDGINTSLMSMGHDIKQVKDQQENMDGRVEELEEERIRELQRFKEERRQFIFKIVTGVAIAAILLWLGLS